MKLTDFGVNKQQATLQNDIPLITFERPGMPISLRVAFLNGSRFDPLGKEGLAHFAEHMIVSGSKKFPTKRDIGLYIENLGAFMNASTSADKMDVYIDYALNSDTKAVIDLIDQFLVHANFESESIERERGAIMAELAGKKSDPGVYIYRLWKQLAYQNDPLGRDTIGSEESLQQISQYDLKNYYKNTLEKNNCVIIASGDISANSLSELFNQSQFIQTRTFSTAKTPTVKRNRTEPIQIKQYPKAEQAHLAFGFPVVPEEHPDFWPLFVLSRILGPSRTSRLSQKLRHDLGLVYFVSASLESWWGSGSLVVYTSCKTENIQLVLDATIKEIQRLKQEEVSVNELNHTQNYLTKMQLLRMQTSAAWVGYHVNSILKNPDSFDTLVQDLAKINAVTPKQIQEVANKYFIKDAWYLAICGDIAAKNITIDS